MNEKIYAVCAEIPRVDREKDLGAFFRSIHNALDHTFLEGRYLNQELITKRFAKLV